MTSNELLKSRTVEQVEHVFNLYLCFCVAVRLTMLSDMDELPPLQIGEYELRLELDEDALDETTRETARRELRETPELRESATIELRALLAEEQTCSGLRCPLDKDAWLVRFLRPTKFYPESAADLVRRYYQFKKKHAQLYDGLLPSGVRAPLEQNVLTVLPQRDQHGRRILVIRLGRDWDHRTCPLDDVFRGAVLFIEAAMLEPRTQICGAVVMFDMDGLSMQQAWQFTPPFAKRIVDLLQDAIALRIKGVHVVNQPRIFNMVFALFKPFLREKLRSRIHMHAADRASLHQHVSPKCLPARYGGLVQLPDVTGQQWLDLLVKADPEYKAIASYGYNKT